MEKEKKHFSMYVFHVIVGFAIVAVFWSIEPIAPITELGMKCVGVFLMMVYLWSTVGALWPSIAGLFLLGITGYAGEGSSGFNAVWLNAMGSDTVLLILFNFVLFGALDEVGDTLYIARWFLTRKMFKGRPFVFLICYYACAFVLAALTSPIISLVLLWPITLHIVDELHITREDKFWKWFFIGLFLVSTLAQPFLPVKGAQLGPIRTFANMSEGIMGEALSIPMIPYMATDLVMTVIVMAVYLVVLKVLKVDMTKLKAVDPAVIEKQLNLPKMNLQQWVYLIMVPLYLIMVLLPSFISGNPVFDFLSNISSMGVSILWVIALSVIRWNGKPLLDFAHTTLKYVNWGILIMVAAAIYGAGTLSDESTGVSEFIVQVLNPVLGNQPEIIFVAIMFTVALIITNFANNAAMAIVLMPVILTFSKQMGYDPIPIAMGVILMVFVAMLTPAASPHAGMMHGRKDIYKSNEILAIGLPMCIVCLLVYIVVGYPFMKFMIGIF